MTQNKAKQSSTTKQHNRAACLMKIKRFLPWVVFLMMAFGLSASARELVNATLSADGKTAYGVVQPATFHPTLYVYAADLQENNITTFHEIPAGVFHRTYIFNQGPDTLLVVPQKPDSDNKAKCHVYVCKPHGPPQLMGGGEGFFIRPTSKPEVWQNNAVLLGEDASGAHALMFIQEGKPTVFELQGREEFAAGIQSMRYATSSGMGYIEVRLYNNQTFHLSPFLTSAGVPLIAEAKRFMGPMKGDTLLRFSKEYYGENKRLELERQGDGSAKLFAVSFLNARSFRSPSKTPLASEPLYHAKVFNQDRELQWVWGYSNVNPQKASVIGYVYDRQSESLTPLPGFDNVGVDNAGVDNAGVDNVHLNLNNMDWSRVRSIISVSPLIFEMGSVDKSDALMVQWDKGTFLYASQLDFSEKPKPQLAAEASGKPAAPFAEDFSAQPVPDADALSAQLRGQWGRVADSFLGHITVTTAAIAGSVLLGLVLLIVFLRRSRDELGPGLLSAPPSKAAAMYFPPPESSSNALWWVAGLVALVGVGAVVFMRQAEPSPPPSPPMVAEPMAEPIALKPSPADEPTEDSTPTFEEMAPEQSSENVEKPETLYPEAAPYKASKPKMPDEQLDKPTGRKTGKPTGTMARSKAEAAPTPPLKEHKMVSLVRLSADRRKSRLAVEVRTYSTTYAPFQGVSGMFVSKNGLSEYTSSKKRRDIENCAKEQEDRDPKLTGTMEVKVDAEWNMLNSQRTVQVRSVSPSHFQGTYFADCVTQIIQGWQHEKAPPISSVTETRRPLNAQHPQRSGGES